MERMQKKELTIKEKEISKWTTKPSAISCFSGAWDKEPVIKNKKIAIEARKKVREEGREEVGEEIS